MEPKSVRPSILILLCLALYAAALARLVLLPVEGATLWRGYYTLLVPERVTLPEVEARLAAAGFKTVSAWSARLQFTDFSGLASEPVADLLRRLDPSDPRFDPYMKGAAALFHAGHDHLIYLKARAGLLATELELGSALSGMPWRLADSSPGAQGGGVALLVLGALLASTAQGNRRRLFAARAVGAVPWIPLAATGEALLVVSSLLLYTGWALFVDRGLSALDEWVSYRRFDAKGLSQGVGATLAGILAVFELGMGKPGLVVAAGAAFAADLAVAAVLYAARIGFLRRQVHRLFVPVAVARRRLPANGERLSILALASLFLLVQAVPLLGGIGAGGVRLPSPVPLAGVNGWSERALARLWREDGNGALPDAASYVAHRAYQASLSYGRPYAFPSPDEKVALASFKREGERIREAPVLVEQLGPAWYSRVMAEGDGLTPLFTEQVRPTATRLARPVDRLGLGARSWLLWPLTCFVFVPLIVLRDDLTPQVMYGMRSPGSRRKQQAA